MIAKRKNANNIREIIESVEYTKRVGSAWAVGAGNDNGSVQKAHGKRKKIVSKAKKGGSPPRLPQRGQQNHDLKIGGKVKIIVHNEETSTTTFCKDTRKCAWGGGEPRPEQVTSAPIAVECLFSK